MAPLLELQKIAETIAEINKNSNNPALRVPSAPDLSFSPQIKIKAPVKALPKALNALRQDYTGHRNRLRERLLLSKTGTMPDYEILELLLFGSSPRQDVKPLAKALIASFGGFNKVFYAEIYELKQIKGLNTAALAIIRAVREALDLILKMEFKNQPILNNWKAVINYLKVSIGNSRIENFRILFLNKKHILMEDYLQDIGTIDQTPLYIREVIKKALALGAASIIIAHNHPSNEAKPSQADIDITMQLQQACLNVEIKLIDHLIITANKHFSFATNGLL